MERGSHDVVGLYAEEGAVCQLPSSSPSLQATHEKTVPNMPSRNSSRILGSSFLALSIAPAWLSALLLTDCGEMPGVVSRGSDDVPRSMADQHTPSSTRA